MILDSIKFPQNTSKLIATDLSVSVFATVPIAIWGYFSDTIYSELKSPIFLTLVALAFLFCIVAYQLDGKSNSIFHKFCIYIALFTGLSFLLSRFNWYVQGDWTPSENLEIVVISSIGGRHRDINNAITRQLDAVLPRAINTDSISIDISTLRNKHSGKLDKSFFGNILKNSNNVLGYLELYPENGSQIGIKATNNSQIEDREHANGVSQWNLEAPNSVTGYNYGVVTSVGGFKFTSEIIKKSSPAHFGFGQGTIRPLELGFLGKTNTQRISSLSSEYYPIEVSSAEFSSFSDKALLYIAGIAGQNLNRYGGSTAICDFINVSVSPTASCIYQQ